MWNMDMGSVPIEMLNCTFREMPASVFLERTVQQLLWENCFLMILQRSMLLLRQIKMVVQIMLWPSHFGKLWN